MNLSTKLRVVLDTNVLISGVLWGGKPGSIIKRWRKEQFILLMSPFILAEFVNFLHESHIERKEKERIIHEFETKSVRINPAKKVDICRDKKDNQILDLCLAAKADYLITGDNDLLVLNIFEGTKIVKPENLLRL